MPQLDNLGLRENPFKNNADPRFFYVDQNRAWILESTEHLIEHSNNLQVIIGPPGVGKSYFLETLTSRMDKNWRIAVINQVEQFNTLSLIQSILNAFGGTSYDTIELLESLETHLAEIIQQGFKPVLIIDDAESLSADSIRFLLQLSQQKQNNEAYINIVLFATVEITEYLQAPELKDFRDIIHIATLKDLDKEGVSGYLRHKMAVAGFDRESPFTPRIIDSIYNNSHGNPEKVNFFANKFLVSSGKVENYIEPETDRIEPETEEHQTNNMTHSTLLNQGNDLINALKDDDLKIDRSDRAEEQINRLTEKFDEIEKMGEQPVDDFFIDKEYIDKESTEKKVIQTEDFADGSSTQQYDNELKLFALPKLIIPIAVLGFILVAIVIINTVFDNTEKSAGEQVNNEQIELLPLELPPEGSITKEGKIEDVADVNQNKSTYPSVDVDTDLPENSLDATQENNTVQVKQLDSEPSVVEPVSMPEPIEQAISTSSTPLPLVRLNMVEPEPIIGSKQRQTITVLGSDLEKDVTLVVTWAGNKKEFSAKQTPEQWNYINKNKIKLHLMTGIESRQWQVYAKNVSGQQSQPVQFEVVKPFIADMAIKAILPDPVIGSDKRQTVTVKGQGFSKQTVIELKWDKNNKHFSSSLSPNQFEYISPNEIKLFITTGTKARKWKVFAKKADSDVTSSSSFSVVLKDSIETTGSLDNNTLYGKRWLNRQPDTNYTIQLLGSHNKQAIDELIRAYSLKGDIAWFETQRNGQSWYSMTYGNYDSKQAANKAIESLNAKLTNPEPWVRSFESIKKQLSVSLTESQLSSTKAPQSQANIIKNESWIWTQNPTDYTLQMLALSTESAVKGYARKHNIEPKSVHFKITRNGKPLYVLIYGQYPDKKSADRASEQMVARIKGSKPWVRSFSEIHGLMTP